MTPEAFHEEVLAWLLPLLTPGKVFTLGVNGPQGAGKTTLTTALCKLLAAKGKRAVTVSVDDFYLTRAEQVALAQKHPENPFFQQRGYPGTHDVALGARILDLLKSPSKGAVHVPRYDKSAHEGQGDRAMDTTEVATPLDVLFFEGWMLGFEPVSRPPEELREVNEVLGAYYKWHERLDGFLQLDPLDYHFVLDWRVEAEERMKAQGKTGMSTEAVRAYAEKFMPAYEVYLPGLRRGAPVKGPLRKIAIGRDRLPAR